MPDCAAAGGAALLTGPEGLVPRGTQEPRILQKIGTSRRRGPRPDQWEIIDGNGRVVRREFDDDGDGVPDRSEPIGGETPSPAPTNLEPFRK
jgi:hypothetical protein